MMKNGAPFNRCAECDEIITNPICSDCLAQNMRVMVGQFDPTLAEDITGFDIEGDTQCIRCGRSMGLCAHCFSKDIYFFLEEKKSSLAEDFLANFDFDLRRELAG